MYEKESKERKREFHTSDNGHGSVVFQLETVYPVACIENWQIGSDPLLLANRILTNLAAVKWRDLRSRADRGWWRENSRFADLSDNLVAEARCSP